MSFCFEGSVIRAHIYLMQPGKVPMLSKQLSREDRLAQQPMDQSDPETVDDFEAVYNGGLAFQVCHVVLYQPGLGATFHKLLAGPHAACPMPSSACRRWRPGLVARPTSSLIF